MGGGKKPTKIIFFWEILFWIAVRFSPLHRRLPLFLFSAPLTSSLVKPARGHYCCVTWAWLRVRMSHAVCSFRLFYLRGIGNVKKRKQKKMIHFKFSNEKKKKEFRVAALVYFYKRHTTMFVLWWTLIQSFLTHSRRPFSNDLKYSRNHKLWT